MTHAAQAQEHLVEAGYALTAAEHAAEGYAHPEVLKYCRRGLQALDNIKPTVETAAIRIDLLLQHFEMSERNFSLKAVEVRPLAVLETQT